MTIFNLILNLISFQDVEMADALRQDGKIYVVVIVISIVLAGLLIYLWTLDRKITKLEKEINNR
jgi:CcmD family protein